MSRYEQMVLVPRKRLEILTSAATAQATLMQLRQRAIQESPIARVTVDGISTPITADMLKAETDALIQAVIEQRVALGWRPAP